jgi:hypothetical protein
MFNGEFTFDKDRFVVEYIAQNSRKKVAKLFAETATSRLANLS